MLIPNFLDRLVSEYNIPSFTENDPILFPKKFTLLQDIEISGFLVSVMTWGKRSMILRNADKILSEMNYKPYEFILSGKFKSGRESLHRTFKRDDFAEICHSLREYYETSDSLENLFLNNNGELCFDNYKRLFSSKHVSDWNKGSASKRLHMFLRWMVRNDGIVDIGCWKMIRPSELFIPLDTHVARNATRLGLLKRKSNDRKAVEELTDRLREFCPHDPVKYDFALFAPGASGHDILMTGKNK